MKTFILVGLLSVGIGIGIFGYAGGKDLTVQHATCQEAGFDNAQELCAYGVFGDARIFGCRLVCVNGTQIEMIDELPSAETRAASPTNRTSVVDRLPPAQERAKAVRDWLETRK